ncbi:MAG: DoxX family membrane protein [Planctomycetota bacterium]
MESNETKGGHKKISTIQSYTLFILRVVVGWHLLYEGVAKLLTPNWSSASYLQYSRWILADFFQWIIANPEILKIVDWLNILGLILIGLALITGCLSRLAAVFGALLLSFYYIAYPPFAGLDVNTVSEGHYLIVNKNLIEIIVLLLIAVFPSGKVGSLGALIGHFLRKMIRRKEPGAEPVGLERRQFVKDLLSLPILAVFGALVWKERKNVPVDAITSPTLKIDEELLKVAGKLPFGQIKDLNVSKLILGANLIGGFAHARDLIYVSDLFRHYNTERKIFQTLMLAELSGVNSIILVPWQMDVVQKYNRLYKGNMQQIAMVDSTEAVDAAISKGASAIYIIGNHCDWTVQDGKVDELGELLDYIRSKGYSAGLGAHSIQALIACDEAGIEPDFYVKTLHHDNYWSAHPMQNRIPFSVDTEKSPDHDQFHDNMFCLFPDKTIDFMKNKQKPWIAYKVLAGGAIHPDDGFKFAFENGADFICVGMFDFQVVEDVNITIDVLSKVTNRERPWMA